MKPKHWLLMAGLAMLATVGHGVADEPAAKDERAAKPDQTDVADLKGRIVAITLMSDSEDLVLLVNVSEKTLGGKRFLAGDGVDDGKTPDWRNAAAVWVPIEDVQQIVTFVNLDQYRKNLEARPERLEGKAASHRPSATRRPGASYGSSPARILSRGSSLQMAN
jgi:hypothetical protein